MNRDSALKIADAVLYEGYMLYPYRPSALKNRQRWTFGTLYPPDYEEVWYGTERSGMHSECLIKTQGDGKLDVQLRFLQCIVKTNADRSEQKPPASGGGNKSEELVPRSAEFILELQAGMSRCFPFAFPEDPTEDNHAEANASEGSLRIAGTVSVLTVPVAHDVLKFSIEVGNETRSSDQMDRDSALPRSLLSAHLLLTTSSAEFVSLLDPPAELREHATGCRNVGNFPVLMGNEGEHGMMLCSPIILYDYPQIAPESGGDYYDSTEMDEMLTLRIMTLTDEERIEMHDAGERVRRLLERTERTAREQLMKTHGTIRSLRLGE